MKGIFDRTSFPEQLEAHVVDPERRVHGYAIAELGDRGFAEVGWLALTGELPTEAQRTTFERALILLMPMHVGEGPTHAAVLGRVAGAHHQVLPAIAAAALGQHTMGELAAPVDDRVATAYALLRELGFTDTLSLHTLSLWARLPVMMAEARHARPGGITAYPARTPDYDYVED